LKPVNINEIAEIAFKLKEKISQEARRVQVVEQLKESVRKDQDIVMESFFQRLVEKRITDEEARRKLMLYNCEKLMESCICINIKLKEEPNEEEFRKSHKKILEIIKQNQYPDSVYFTHYLQNIILYIAGRNYEEVTKLAYSLHEQVGENIGVHTTIGISLYHEEFAGISQAYEESKLALSVSVYLGRNRCVTFREYEEVMSQNENRDEFDWEEFLFAVTNGLTERTKIYIAEYVNLIRSAKVTDMEYIRLMTMDILTRGGTTLHKYGISMTQLIGEEQLYQEVRKINTVEEVGIYLEKAIGMIMEYHEAKKIKQGNKVVEEAVSFIDDNLCDPELSLRLVASKIFSNESYLSRVFKKEKGFNLIEYITKKRIEESIRLLNTTDLKVYEIAEQIGFRDSHYFSICFKKQTGVTVKEFKRIG
jgi:two-component system response regulator YesN